MSNDDWREEFQDELLRALFAREFGNDVAALGYLDAASKIYYAATGEQPPQKKKRRGRPKLERDPDRIAVAIMNSHAKRTGERRAETLARFVLKVPDFRRASHNEIGDSDVKRLAAKWKAQPKI